MICTSRRENEIKKRKNCKKFFIAFNIKVYTGRNFMVENTVFGGKPEPLGISAS